MDLGTPASGYAATASDSGLAPFHFQRRALRAEDVAIAIRYCGVCHSDLHQARNDWGFSRYPLVPGHEIVGEVTAVGSGVTKFAVGDAVAVGCMVDSCLECASCRAGDEQYCLDGNVQTYGGRDRTTGDPTYGGYSDHIVVREHFVLSLPPALDAAHAAPILCAGITTWSPLRYWQVGPGSTVAVVGLGGLGHMGVMLAAGLGAVVTVVTTSPAKEADALALGAHAVLVSTDKDAMKAATGRFDFILDTVPVVHDAAPYLKLLKSGGSLVLVGIIGAVPTFHSGMLLGGRKSLAGSAIGGIAETQELLAFCAEKNIHPLVEMVAMRDIATAFSRMETADVKYRFVIDMATLPEALADSV